MHSTASDSAVLDPAGPDRASPARPRDVWAYAGAWLLGSVLIVVTAIRQPFSYDELTQIAPYDSSDPGTITGATRQPPIDPLLGALFHHLFGEGQLQDRLVPVLAGIGSLTFMGLLLRRLGLRFAGAAALLVMATAPLFVRYSAYTRPYALPMFVMIVMAYAVQSWLKEGRGRWLWLTAVAAFLLPLIRVPEPTVFLVITAVIMGWYTWRGRLTRRQSLPVLLIAVAAVLSMGLAQYFSLAESSNGFFDPSPSGVVDRFPEGVHELVTAFVPLMGNSFPWWPVTLLVVLAAAVLGAARSRLVDWPMWWPLVAAPVAFAIAYHFVNPFPFDAIPYRARAASFFIPAFVLLVAALASVVERRDLDQRIRVGAAALVGAAFLTQLPPTITVVRDDAAPDFGVISEVITSQVPANAIVLYDRPTPAGASRQPFLGNWRYMGDTPYVETLSDLPRQLDSMPSTGPVYLLFNGQCAYSGRCIPASRTAVDIAISGWHIAYQHERFTLYAPDHEQDGPAGVVEAMQATRAGLGLELGYLQTYVAATVLAEQGQRGQGKALIEQMFAQADPEMADVIRHEEAAYDLDPFGLDPASSDN